MSDNTVLEIIARHRTQKMMALLAASDDDDGMEEDVYRLYLALEQHMDERARAMARPSTALPDDERATAP